MSSAICSPYWCLAGSVVCRIAEGASHCAIRVSHISENFQNFCKFLLQQPDCSIWERDAPRQNPAPPLA